VVLFSVCQTYFNLGARQSLESQAVTKLRPIVNIITS
jgi:hypothetical protein